MSLQYLVKCGYSKFLANTGFITVRLLRFGVTVQRAYCHDNLLAQMPLQDMRRLSQDEFFVFQQDGAPAHPEHNTDAFLEEERRERRVVV